MKIQKNKAWESKSGNVSIITPVYNRRATLERTMKSVFAQTYKNLEYVIVDDGSLESIDDIVHKFMCLETIPILFLKKQNGGVHTARNLALDHCRGNFIINLDSDDELLPDAIEIFLRAWESIPGKKQEYREVVAQCMDDNGMRCGHPFPDNINSISWNEAQRICGNTGGDHVGFFTRESMSNARWPEPDGVTFVTENILWKRLSQRYKSYFINDMVLIYHHDTDNALTRVVKKNVQNCINQRWHHAYLINNRAEYGIKGKTLSKHLIKFAIQDCIVKKYKKDYNGIELENIWFKFAVLLLRIPATIGAQLYIKRKM